MEKMIAYCGLNCYECPVLIATKNDDDAMRKETAAAWSKQYNAEIKPEDINCEGCLPGAGIVFYYCNIFCEIRKCAQEKSLENCAYCNDYGCQKLEKSFETAPMAKATLDKIRQGLYKFKGVRLKNGKDDCLLRDSLH